MQKETKIFATMNHNKYSTIPEVMDELKRISNIAFPMLAMNLLSYLKTMILVISMGRLGALELAGGALAIGFTNITGYSVLSGLATGMEPLCSQAFGSKNHSLASHVLKKTIVLLMFCSFPISILWLNLETIMLALHQKPDILHVAKVYCLFAIPDLIAHSFLHPIRIYLRTKGTTWPLFWSYSISIFFHVPITYVLAFTLSLGVPGVAVSNFITDFSTVFILLCYMYYNNNNINENIDNSFDTRPLLQKDSISSPILENEWGTLIRLAIPSCIAVCLEWWWYEFMTILTGYLENPRVALASAAIVIQTTALMYTLPISLAASVSTRVGNELGAGRAKRARLSAAVGLGLALVASLFGLLWTTLGRKIWAEAFSNDSEILELTMTVLPLIGLCEVGNCPQTTGCGILRGCAKPGVGAAINFYSFYLVGAPLAVVLGFVWKKGFLGLCYGLLGAQIACVVSILGVVYKIDWERESLKAKELVGAINKTDGPVLLA